MACKVTFRIDDQGMVKNDDQVLCIVGNCEELGMWCHKNVVEMQRNDTASSVWTLVKELPEDQNIQYRYAVCSFHGTPENKRAVIIHHWETHLTPRQFESKGPQMMEDGGKFGIVDDVKKVDKGWLTEQSEIRLYIHDCGDKDLITKYDTHEDVDNGRKDENIRYSYKVSAKMTKNTSSVYSPKKAKVSPGATSTGQTSSLSTNSVPVYVQVLNDSDHESERQGPYGHVFQGKDYVIFSAQTLQPQCLVFTIEVFEHRGALTTESPPKRLGVAHLLPGNMVESSGYSNIPIHGSSHEPVGELSVQYLLIHPFKSDLCDMSISYTKHWKERQAVHIGHRGCGRSEVDAVDSGRENLPSESLSAVKENTISGFHKAESFGIDLIETDILLSKDMIPVIYHDFVINLNTIKRKSQSRGVFEVPVSDLTLEQLQSLKLSHAGETTHQHTTPEQEEEEDSDFQPFPTLKQVLEKVPKHVGFDLEIKYPQTYVTEEKEQEGTFLERNIYLDTILKVVMENAGHRRIFFSCFCPDVCVMLRQKQNRYPVMFITYGESDRWASYKDQRCSSVATGTHSILADDLLGVVLYTEHLLNDRWLITAMKEAGLVVVCWGDDNNNPGIFADMKRLGVDGIVYDKVSEFEQPRKNIFLKKTEGK
ncbi:glycerophosphocholine phosphodiesterase GPCPD1-like isoform X2 [Glandiceps talaboti]